MSTTAARFRPRCSCPIVDSRRLSWATARWTAARSCEGLVGSARSSSASGRAGGSFCGALDQRALELATQVPLEAVDLLAVERRLVRLLLWARLRLQAERAADPLHVDADDAGALALAAEGCDRQPGEVSHLAVVARGDRLADRLAQLVEVEAVAAARALGLGQPLLEGLGLGCTEEEAVEQQLEDAAVLLRLGDRRGERLAEVGGVRPGHRAERLERVEHLRGADGDALVAKLLAEAGEPWREAGWELSRHRSPRLRGRARRA